MFLLFSVLPFTKYTWTNSAKMIFIFLCSVIGTTEAPRKNYNLVASLYFIAFVIMGSLVLMQLLVGVIVSNFQRIKEKFDGVLFLTAVSFRCCFSSFSSSFVSTGVRESLSNAWKNICFTFWHRNKKNGWKRNGLLCILNLVLVFIGRNRKY